MGKGDYFYKGKIEISIVFFSILSVKVEPGKQKVLEIFSNRGTLMQ